MVQKFGVSMDDDLAEQVTEPLEYGESRSERICELVELGFTVEDVADSMSVQLPEDPRERRAFLRQVFIDADI